MASTIYVVRHGVTYANLEDRVQGRDNSASAHMTPEGLTEATNTGIKFREELRTSHLTVREIYTSPLERTWLTAILVGSYIGFPPDKISKEEMLMELDAGDLVRKTRRDLQEDPRYSGFYKEPDFPIPGSIETQRGMYNRVANFMDRLLEETLSWDKTETVLIATHNGPIRCIQAYISGVPLENIMRDYYAKKIRYPNTMLARISIDKDGSGSRTFDFVE